MSYSVHCRRSSWELPELREGRVKAISDSDGVSYPWYGNTTETVTLTGPTSKPSRLTVSMNDNFYPSVTWAVPISNSNTPMLTHITRDQSFITWLVAMNSVTKVGQSYRDAFMALKMNHFETICIRVIIPSESVYFVFSVSHNVVFLPSLNQEHWLCSFSTNMDCYVMISPCTFAFWCKVAQYLIRDFFSIKPLQPLAQMQHAKFVCGRVRGPILYPFSDLFHPRLK